MTGTLDMAQVRTFVLLYETRSVTATAELMRLSQPTVSYTLAKLRRRFGEDLFVRGREGLRPSARAREMYPALRDALATIDRTFAGPAEFDPATTEREFSVMLSDFGELSFLPLLLPALARRAPGAWLRARKLVVDEFADLLVAGRLDLAVTSAPPNDDRVVGRPFLRVDYALIAAADHPRARGGALDEEGFARERFVTVHSSGDHLGPLRLLRRLGLEDRVELELASYASAPYVVATSDVLAIVPRHIAEVFARRHALSVIDLPRPIEAIDVTAYTRRSASPAQRWMADLVVETLADQRLT
ncbi:LysR family transcriptional regulator [Nocardioides insulae]|uniref:LysR family transcriptional regulator n=1 Tax=Nocardioides insulae TaxID=394734 RepID=UPI0004108928|nr:LysR family transcriptional regulator [Nocardioides insulae]